MGSNEPQLSSEPNPKQQRRTPRMVVDIPVQVFFPGSGVRPTHGRGHDISLGGMALYVPSEIAENQTLQIMFQLPHSRLKLGLQGVVRNRNGFRYGISFTQLAPLESGEIERVASILALTGDTR